MDKYFIHVQFLCKSLWKSPCIFYVKLCGFFTRLLPIRAKLIFSTHFYSLSHQVIHSLLTSGFKQCFPLFHNPYYYNYKIFNNN